MTFAEYAESRGWKHIKEWLYDEQTGEEWLDHLVIISGMFNGQMHGYHLSVGEAVINEPDAWSLQLDLADAAWRRYQEQNGLRDA